MKKFICVFVCMIIMTMMMVGCAKTVEVAPTEVTVPVVETEPATTEAPTSNTDAVAEFEKSLDEFNTDTMFIYFTWSDERDGYFIWLDTPISWSYFYSQAGYEEMCAGFDEICLEGKRASGVDTYFTVLGPDYEVIYASYNGTDFTLEAMSAFE